MEIIQFGEGKEMMKYDSVTAFYTKIMKTETPATIGLIHIEQGGVVGFHVAPVTQLFMVIEGEGWIEGEDRGRVPLKSGEAVLWNKGEGHVSGSETGLTALVLQSEGLKPHK